MERQQNIHTKSRKLRREKNYVKIAILSKTGVNQWKGSFHIWKIHTIWWAKLSGMERKYTEQNPACSGKEQSGTDPRPNAATCFQQPTREKKTDPKQESHLVACKWNVMTSYIINCRKKITFKKKNIKPSWMLHSCDHNTST